MVVIKEGKIPDTTKRFTCGRCGCVFECTNAEYLQYFSQIKDETTYQTQCPTCKQRVFLTEKGYGI